MPTITGRLYEDNDSSGTLTAGDFPEAGITVKLMSGASVIASAVTDASGDYSITAPDGTYTLEAVAPTGYTLACPAGGTKKYSVTLAGTNLSGGDFAATPISGMRTVTGRVFNDLNGSGVFDGTEPNLPNVTVQLIDPVTGIVVASTTTDATGNYTLGAPVGDYVLTVVPPVNMAAACTTGTRTYSVHFAAGNLTGADFALTPTNNTAPTLTSPTANTVLFGATPAAVTATDTEGNYPITYTVTSGSLPTGTTMGLNGSISGSATAPGTYSAVVQTTDALGAGSSRTITWTVLSASPPTITSPATVTLALGSGASSLTATDPNGLYPLVFALVGGAVPAGLTLNADGTFSGATTTTGTFNFTAKVTDSAGMSSTKTFTYTVAAVIATRTRCRC